jgi:hypothetical protein
VTRARRTALLGQWNPVPPLSRCTVAARTHGLESAVTAFDGGGGRTVTVVAREESSFNTILPRYNQWLEQDLGCMASPPKRRTDTVADVPADLCQIVIEPVADRYASHKLALHLGDQERGGHPTLRKIDPSTLVTELLKVGVPGLALPTKEELDILRSQLEVCLQGWCLSVVC